METEMAPPLSASERGYLGYLATRARYGSRQMDAWRRTGGRKRNRTYEEIVGSIPARRALRVVRRHSHAKGGRPGNTAGIYRFD